MGFYFIKKYKHGGCISKWNTERTALEKGFATSMGIYFQDSL
jgi:hypothetical protein